MDKRFLLFYVIISCFSLELHPLSIKVSVLRSQLSNQTVYLFHDFHYELCYKNLPHHKQELIKQATQLEIDQLKQKTDQLPMRDTSFLIETNKTINPRAISYIDYDYIFLYKLPQIINQCIYCDNRHLLYGGLLTTLNEIHRIANDQNSSYGFSTLANQYQPETRLNTSIDDIINQSKENTYPFVQFFNHHHLNEIDELIASCGAFCTDANNLAKKLYDYLENIFAHQIKNVGVRNESDLTTKIFTSMPYYERPERSVINEVSRTLFDLYSSKKTLHKFRATPLSQIILGFNFLALLDQPYINKSNLASQTIFFLNSVTTSYAAYPSVEIQTLFEIFKNESKPKIVLFSGGKHCQKIKAILRLVGFDLYFESSLTSMNGKSFNDEYEIVTDTNIDADKRSIDQWTNMITDDQTGLDFEASLFNINATGLGIFDVLDDQNLERLRDSICQ